MKQLLLIISLLLIVGCQSPVKKESACKRHPEKCAKVIEHFYMVYAIEQKIRALEKKSQDKEPKL